MAVKNSARAKVAEKRNTLPQNYFETLQDEEDDAEKTEEDDAEKTEDDDDDEE